MCGIVGYVGKRSVTDVLVQGLKRLEYRGYDSAGVAYFENGEITLRKSEGKIVNLEKLLNGSPKSAFPKSNGFHCGIGHTRWATHGRPTTQNAHPHRTGHVVLVHNGIIENYKELKKQILENGYEPTSETDSELFGFLVLARMNQGLGLMEAVRESFKEVEGACSMVVMSDKEPGVIVGVRNGSPLVLAKDPEGGVFFASDAQPILDYTQEVIFLENEDLVKATVEGLEIRNLSDNQLVERKTHTLDWSPEKLDKLGYAHYMLKEIHEQPRALVDTLNSILDRAHTDPFPLLKQPGVEILNRAKSIQFVACGTSWHAALLGQYWLERWAEIPCFVEYASEYRYRDPVVDRDAVVIALSQSGETADTLAVIREMRARGIATIGLTNVRGSSLEREADATFFTSAGPEIGVAATKTFTAQLLVLMLWAGNLALRRGRDTVSKVPHLFENLLKIPHLLENGLQEDAPMLQAAKKTAKAVAGKKGFFFVGRGYSHPISLEGALKLKEIAYVHAEGYAAGELKHGPIAMIDEEMVAVVLAPKDSWHEKTLSNLQELKARGAIIVGIGCPSDEKLQEESDHFIPLPEASFLKDMDESLYPFLLSPAIQLLSYEIALLKGTNVDQPRNLAKSVTVE
jgi:glutamine---fructose-6-phosphate transaminase (isomerizing)